MLAPLFTQGVRVYIVCGCSSAHLHSLPPSLPNTTALLLRLHEHSAPPYCSCRLRTATTRTEVHRRSSAASDSAQCSCSLMSGKSAGQTGKAAAGATGKSAASSSSKGQEDKCERCQLSDSTNGDELVLCSHLGCTNALHEACFAHFTGVKLPRDEKERDAFDNYCSVHALESTPQHDDGLQVHNLPELYASLADAEADDASAAYLPHTSWQEGLQFNADQRGLTCSKSKVEGAGQGLFAAKDFKKGAAVGFFYGMFRSKSWFDAAKGDIMKHPCVWRASQLSEEDFGESAFDGTFRVMTFPELPSLKQVGLKPKKGSVDHPVLMVSKQCPLAYANSPHPQKSDAAAAAGAAGPAANVKLVVFGDAAPSERYCAQATKAIKKNDEIIFDYGWTETDWTAMRKQRKIAHGVEVLTQRWKTSTFRTEELYAWAMQYTLLEQTPVHWLHRDGLAYFLATMGAQLPSEKEMKDRYEAVWADGQIHILYQSAILRCYMRLTFSRLCAVAAAVSRG